MFKDVLNKLINDPSEEDVRRVTRELTRYVWGEFKGNRSISAYPNQVEEHSLDTYQAVIEIAASNNKKLMLKFARCFGFFGTKGKGFVLRQKYYYLISALRGYHEFNFWISIAKIITEPDCLPFTKDFLADILAIRKKLGIERDEKRIYERAMNTAESRQGTNIIEKALFEFGEKPSRGKIKKAISELKLLLYGTPEWEQRRISDIALLATGDNTVAKRNLALCLVFGEKEQYQKEFCWIDHRYKRYFPLWPILMKLENEALWVAVAQILTEPPLVSSSATIEILVRYRADKKRWDGGLYAEEKRIYQDANIL